MNFNKKVLIIVLILFIVFLLLYVFKVQNVILKQIYPLKYTQWVEKYAKEYDVDDLLIYAIIKAESNFDEKANSTSNAKGLMQVLETTADDIAKDLGNYNMGDYDLYDPETNIMFGTKYFSYLLKDYSGNELLAMAAYNAGKGNIKRWIENGTIKADGSDIENIPYKETTTYVRKISRNYKIYKMLYE